MRVASKQNTKKIVIPAKAGTQFTFVPSQESWVPAFPGMTFFVSRPQGAATLGYANLDFKKSIVRRLAMSASPLW
jgi:hypothetical protein